MMQKQTAGQIAKMQYIISLLNANISAEAARAVRNAWEADDVIWDGVLPTIDGMDAYEWAEALYGDDDE